MYYPYFLVNECRCTMFRNNLKGDGVFFDLSDTSPLHDKLNFSSQNDLQNYANQQMQKHQTNWGISAFGEYRQKMFTALGYEQMVLQKRFYHLGLDFWGAVGTSIHAPFDGTIMQSQYESGTGNYGGMIVLKITSSTTPYYIVFGHLDIDTLSIVNTTINKGDLIGHFGDMTCNGGYFHHSHIQVLTQKGYEQGYAHQGYATRITWQNIQEYCLDPTFLLFV